jgi:hypothetical protein
MKRLSPLRGVCDFSLSLTSRSALSAIITSTFPLCFKRQSLKLRKERSCGLATLLLSALILSHHSVPGSLAPHVDVAIICVPHEAESTPGELLVQLIEHDVAEQRRQRPALRRAAFRRYDDPIGQYHTGAQHLADDPKHAAIRNALLEPRHEPVVVDLVEELREVDVDHPVTAFLQIFVLWRTSGARTSATSSMTTFWGGFLYWMNVTGST